MIVPGDGAVGFVGGALFANAWNDFWNNWAEKWRNPRRQQAKQLNDILLKNTPILCEWLKQKKILGTYFPNNSVAGPPNFFDPEWSVDQKLIEDFSPSTLASIPVIKDKEGRFDAYEALHRDLQKAFKPFDLFGENEIKLRGFFWLNVIYYNILSDFPEQNRTEKTYFQNLIKDFEKLCCCYYIGKVFPLDGEYAKTFLSASDQVKKEDTSNQKKTDNSFEEIKKQLDQMMQELLNVRQLHLNFLAFSLLNIKDQTAFDSLEKLMEMKFNSSASSQTSKKILDFFNSQEESVFDEKYKIDDFFSACTEITKTDKNRSLFNQIAFAFALQKNIDGFLKEKQKLKQKIFFLQKIKESWSFFKDLNIEQFPLNFSATNKSILDIIPNMKSAGNDLVERIDTVIDLFKKIDEKNADEMEQKEDEPVLNKNKKATGPMIIQVVADQVTQGVPIPVKPAGDTKDDDFPEPTKNKKKRVEEQKTAAPTVEDRIKGVLEKEDEKESLYQYQTIEASSEEKSKCFGKHLAAALLSKDLAKSKRWIHLAQLNKDEATIRHAFFLVASFFNSDFNQNVPMPIFGSPPLSFKEALDFFDPLTKKSGYNRKQNFDKNYRETFLKIKNELEGSLKEGESLENGFHGFFCKLMGETFLKVKNPLILKAASKNELNEFYDAVCNLIGPQDFFKHMMIVVDSQERQDFLSWARLKVHLMGGDPFKAWLADVFGSVDKDNLIGLLDILAQDPESDENNFLEAFLNEKKVSNHQLPVLLKYMFHMRFKRVHNFSKVSFTFFLADFQNKWGELSREERQQYLKTLNNFLCEPFFQQQIYPMFEKGTVESMIQFLPVEEQTKCLALLKPMASEIKENGGDERAAVQKLPLSPSSDPLVSSSHADDEKNDSKEKNGVCEKRLVQKSSSGSLEYNSFNSLRRSASSDSPSGSQDEDEKNDTDLDESFQSKWDDFIKLRTAKGRRDWLLQEMQALKNDPEELAILMSRVFNQDRADNQILTGQRGLAGFWAWLCGFCWKTENNNSAVRVSLIWNDLVKTAKQYILEGATAEKIQAENNLAEGAGLRIDGSVQQQLKAAAETPSEQEEAPLRPAHHVEDKLTHLYSHRHPKAGAFLSTHRHWASEQAATKAAANGKTPVETRTSRQVKRLHP